MRRLFALLCAAALIGAGCDDDHHDSSAPSADPATAAAAAEEDSAAEDSSGEKESRSSSIEEESDQSRDAASTDTGDNDPGLVVCIGDSLTAGINCVGAAYPERLAALCGKRVVNLGVGGVSSAYGRSHVSEALSRKPGYVCILYGTNDPGHSIGASDTAANVRSIVQACKAQSCVPVVGTPPPVVAPHRDNNAALSAAAAAIRAVAKEEGAALVDLHAAFSSDPEKYLNPEDGLHFSDAGGDLVARKFDARL